MLILVFFRNIILSLSVFCMLLACNTSKYLNKEKQERLLVKNQLEIKAPAKFGNKFELKYNLEALYKQVPNQKILFSIRANLVYYYWFHKKNSKAAKWFVRKFGEPPTIYKEDLTQKTAQNFENYAKQRGYLNAKCTYKTDFTDSKAKVKYTLNFNNPYKIGKIEFISRDSAIQSLLRANAPNSLLKTKGILDGNVFDAEKVRITNELKNNGYAYFIPNFIEFIGDTTGTKSDVTVEILPFNDTTNHKIYKVGKVAVFSSLVPDYSSIRQDTTIGGVYFASSDPIFLVKPPRLYEAIKFKPGAIYSQEDFDRTYRNLNALGIFKFVAIKPVQDTLNSEKLDITISFSPNKRIRWSWGADANTSNSLTTNRYIGAATNLTFEHRNLARGAEHLTSLLGYNIEFDFSNRDRLVNSNEFKFENDLTIPRFFDYMGFWKNTHKLAVGKGNNLISNRFYKKMQTDARTRLSIGDNFLDIFNFYKFNLFHASLGYDLNLSNGSKFSVDHLGVDVFTPITQPSFDSIFGRNEFLKNSLSNQLFTGLFLRSMSFNFTGNNNRFGERWSFRVNQELSGVEQFLAKEIYSAMSKNDAPWNIGSLEFSKFLRLDVDGSYTRDFNRSISAVFRVGSGVLLPFGDSKFTPFVKQFSIGGPSSLRAWRIREIGPGGSNDLNKPYQAPFSQTADFRFEFNSELRFPVFWLLKGAVFLDGGNIWTLKPETKRLNTQLALNSYKNIALGSGVGFRLDITFAVIRIDIGYKLRWPYPDYKGEYWVGKHQRDVFWDATNGETKSENRFNWNIAVGYPF
jgi:outer membrane protein insertion porin family